MNYNNSWLTEIYKSGERPKFLFFWGHQSSKDGTITSSCFSQWWCSPFEVAGQQYRTAEHWMMAEKARLFKDTVLLDKILQSKTLAEVKKLGRLINNFDASVWDEHKYDTVVTGNFHKFSQSIYCFKA